MSTTQYKERRRGGWRPDMDQTLRPDILADTQEVAGATFSLRPDLHNFTNIGVRSGQSVPGGIGV